MTLNKPGLVGFQTSASFSETVSLITSCYGGKYELRWEHRPVKTFRGKRGRITLWGHKKLPRPRRSLAKYEVFFWSQRSPH